MKCLITSMVYLCYIIIMLSQVVIERAKRSQLPDLAKFKYLFHATFTGPINYACVRIHYTTSNSVHTRVHSLHNVVVTLLMHTHAHTCISIRAHMHTCLCTPIHAYSDYIVLIKYTLLIIYGIH